MIKNLLLLFLLCCTIALEAQPTDSTRIQCYKGKVDGKYSITMELKIVGSRCEGRYYYDKYRQDILLIGAIEADQKIVLQEIDNKGNLVGSNFEGTHSDNWSSLEGVWQEQTNDKRFDLSVQAIYAAADSNQVLNFEKVRRFQAWFNAFDLEVALPLRVTTETTMNWKWKKKYNKTELADFEAFLPYILAKQFVMQQVDFVSASNYNYWQILPQDYNPIEVHYQSIGQVFRRQNFVGLLLQLEVNNGWEKYHTICLLTYDYEGNLLGNVLLAQSIDTQTKDSNYVENTTSLVAANGVISTTATIQKSNLNRNKAGVEDYSSSSKEQEILSILQPTGSFAKQEISQ